MGGRLERIVKSFGNALRGTSEKINPDTTGIFDAVNRFRKNRGLYYLEWSPKLAEQATAQASLLRDSENLIDSSRTDRICFRWPSFLVKSVQESGQTIGMVAIQTAIEEPYQFEILVGGYSHVGVGWILGNGSPEQIICTCVVDFGWE